MTEIPDPNASDDAAVLVGIAQSIARALAEAMTIRPDLLDGFLADRYRLAVAYDHLIVLVSDGPDIHTALDLPSR